jgi:hypothetical protein
MDPTLLFSSMFIFFFFGFNAENFIGTDEASFTVLSLIERAAKSFCGSTMVYGIGHFSSILLEQYANDTLTLGWSKNNPTISAASTATTASSTAINAMKQLGENASEQRPNNDTQWDERRGPNPPVSKLFAEPNAHQLYVSKEGVESFLTYLNDTLARPVLETTTYQEVNLKPYMTHHDFAIFVFTILLPGLVLWSLTRPNRRRPERRTQEVSNPEAQPPYCLECLARNTVPSVPHQNPQVPAQQPLVTERLDEILAFLKGNQDQVKSLGQSEEVNAAELESLRNIVDTIVSNSTSQEEDMQLLRRGQARIERRIPDLKAVEERVNKVDGNFQALRKSLHQEVASLQNENLQELRNLEENNRDCLRLIEKIQEEIVMSANEGPDSEEDVFVDKSKIGKKILLKDKLQWHTTLIDDLNERVENAGTALNARLEEVEQAQKETTVPSDLAGKLDDLDKRVGQAQKQGPVPDYTSRFQNLEKRVDKTEMRIPKYSDPTNKLNDLNRQVIKLRDERPSLLNIEEQLKTLHDKVYQDNALLTTDFEKTLETHEEDISTLKDKIDKIKSEQQAVNVLQQTLNTHDKDIDTLKKKADAFESEQHSIDERVRQISEQNSGITVERLNSLEKTFENRIIEKTDEVQTKLEEQASKDFTELGMRLDKVEDTADEVKESHTQLTSTLEGHTAEIRNIQSQLTAQEEQQTQASIQELTTKLEKITETIESLHDLHRQENNGLESMFSSKIEGLDKQMNEVKDKAGEIQVEVSNLKGQVAANAANALDTAAVIAWVEQLQTNIKSLDEQVGFLLEMQAMPTTENTTGNSEQSNVTTGQIPEPNQSANLNNNVTAPFSFGASSSQAYASTMGNNTAAAFTFEVPSSQGQGKTMGNNTAGISNPRAPIFLPRASTMGINTTRVSNFDVGGLGSLPGAMDVDVPGPSTEPQRGQSTSVLQGLKEIEESTRRVLGIFGENYEINDSQQQEMDWEKMLGNNLLNLDEAEKARLSDPAVINYSLSNDPWLYQNAAINYTVPHEGSPETEQPANIGQREISVAFDEGSPRDQGSSLTTSKGAVFEQPKNPQHENLQPKNLGQSKTLTIFTDTLSHIQGSSIIKSKEQPRNL